MGGNETGEKGNIGKTNDKQYFHFVCCRLSIPFAQRSNDDRPIAATHTHTLKFNRSTSKNDLFTHTPKTLRYGWVLQSCKKKNDTNTICLCQHLNACEPFCTLSYCLHHPQHHRPNCPPGLPQMPSAQQAELLAQRSAVVATAPPFCPTNVVVAIMCMLYAVTDVASEKSERKP